MLVESDFTKYASKAFSLECQKIVLQRGEGNSAQIYEGPGSIFQNSVGQLKCKLYSPAALQRNEAIRQSFNPMAGVQAGEIIPDSEYFSLIASAFDGSEWRSDRLLVSPKYAAGFRSAVIESELYELYSVASLPQSKDGSGFSVRFWGTVNFPANTHTETKEYVAKEEVGWSGDFRVARFTSCGIAFELHKTDEWVIFHAEHNKPNLPENIETRALEALRFVLADSLVVAVKRKSENGLYKTTLCSSRGFASASHVEPPVSFHPVDRDGDVWKLFDYYLRHILDYSGLAWHPISRYVSSFLQARGASIEAQALTLVVAIEGLLNFAFPTLAAPGQDVLDQIDKATKLLRLTPCLTVEFKNRLNGLIGTLKKANAQGKLRSLVEDGKIRKVLADTWAHRHTIVHQPDSNRHTVEDLFKIVQTLHTLFNELILLAIGYSGKYTDYSTIGWPNRVLG